MNTAAMIEFELRDLLRNGTHFIFADGWKKCFAAATRSLVADETQARSLVEDLLAGLSAATYQQTRHIPAWEIDAHLFELSDSGGKAWIVSLFLSQGSTVVHKVKPAS